MDEHIENLFKKVISGNDIADKAALERALVRSSSCCSSTKRANILVLIRYSEYVKDQTEQRTDKSIDYRQILRDFKEDNEAVETLVLQDIFPVHYYCSDLTGKNSPPLDQVRFIETLEEDGCAAPLDMKPVELPNLHTIDANGLVEMGNGLGYLDDVLRKVPLLAKIFPFQGKKRTIIMPDTDFCDENDILKRHQLYELLKFNDSKFGFYFPYIVYTSLNDEDAEVLAKSVDCENLTLRAAILTDRGLAALAKIKKMKCLTINLSKLNISEKGLEEFLETTTLESLDLESARNISGEAFGKHGHGLKTLVFRNFITDKGLQTIVENCPCLEELKLYNPNINFAETFQYLKKLKKLNTLAIEDCSALDHEAIKAISSIHTLTSLDLENNIITDEDLENISNLPNLKDLILSSGAGFTSSGIEKFQSKLTNCEIVTE